MGLPAAPRTVITGAGSGFGRALALELAGRGAHLTLGDVDERSVEETKAMATSRGAASARAMRCDVTKLEDVQALAAMCPDGVDLVVNNAGVSSGGRVGELPMEDWRWTLDVDLFGVIHGCHVFVPMLRQRGKGHVLNVASAAGLVSAPNMGAYNVAKAGVVSLSETLAAELSGTSIGVTVLCPTFFRTNIAASGRFRDPKTKVTAERLVSKGKSAEMVARAALKAVERGELYCVPMSDGSWFWRLKRLSPTAFQKFAGLVGRWMPK
jgi:NAD(P)-dependent dehydrogenase (short-subunit alcohol dehydrogenase family)